MCPVNVRTVSPLSWNQGALAGTGDPNLAVSPPARPPPLPSRAEPTARPLDASGTVFSLQQLTGKASMNTFISQ